LQKFLLDTVFNKQSLGKGPLQIEHDESQAEQLVPSQ
jgi:hypothetical protein